MRDLAVGMTQLSLDFLMSYTILSFKIGFSSVCNQEKVFKSTSNKIKTEIIAWGGDGGMPNWKV